MNQELFNCQIKMEILQEEMKKLKRNLANVIAANGNQFVQQERRRVKYRPLLSAKLREKKQINKKPTIRKSSRVKKNPDFLMNFIIIRKRRDYRSELQNQNAKTLQLIC